jgi:hypothetical protein
VRVAIMPQPMSTPTAAGMIAPRVGITLPIVEPLPRCTSGITARWRKMNGRRAVLISCRRAASSSTGTLMTPSVHILIGSYRGSSGKEPLRIIAGENVRADPVKEPAVWEMTSVETVAALVDIGELDGIANLDLARIRLLLADQHAEQRRFAGAVRADDADDGAWRHVEAQLVDQQTVTEGLADVPEFDHLAAQALADRNEDLLGLVPLLVLDAGQFLET